MSLSERVPYSRWKLARWVISTATLNVPQAGGPIAFSLVALALMHDTRGGAAMMLAMTLAQVAGAVPLARLARRLPVATCLRLLIGFRTLALLGIAFAAWREASFVWLIVLAAVAGSVNGAAHGFLRAVLNHLAAASQLPRALGIAATLNELTFVLAPVAASGLGSISPVIAVLVLALLGALPALLVPDVGSIHGDGVRHGEGRLLSRAIAVWLLCALAGGATVASIEIGSVALALHFGHEPALAILFTVPLCLSSVAGGIWTSVRNRRASRPIVLAQLCVMALGSALVALSISLTTTIIGAVLIGCVLAPLSTYYSLTLDTLAPPQRRPEIFALLRTANASGVIVASGVLTVTPLPLALVVITALMTMAALTVALHRRP